MEADIKKLGRKYISYIAASGGNWWVRFYAAKVRGHQGITLQKSFRVNHYKNSESAYRAAVRWRNKIIREHPEILNKTRAGDFLRAKAHIRNRRHKGLIAGIQLQQRENRKPAYITSWQESIGNGERQQRVKQFSFPEYDLDAKHAAYKKAVQLRKRMIKQHYIGTL